MYQKRYIALRLLSSLLIVFAPAQIVLADSNDGGANYTQNDITAYDPTNSNQCTSSGTGATIANFSPDPAATAIFESDIAPKLVRLAPLYQQAAKAQGMADWQLLAGIHYVEFGLQTTNPTSNLSYRGIFQMNASSLANNGIDPNSPIFQPGRQLTDSDIEQQAEDAISTFLKGDANASTVNVDLSQPLTYDGALNLIIAYSAGPASSWFNDPVNKNLYAYALAGYDTTAAHKLPMTWGKGSPTPDPNPTRDLPGALTVWAMVRSGTGGGVSSCNNGTASAPTVDNVVFYSQYNPKWANVYVSAIDDTIAGAGCYLTSNAMIISTLTGKNVLPSASTELTPDEMATTYGLTMTPLNDNLGPPSAAALQQMVNDFKTKKNILVIAHGYDGGGLFWDSYQHWVVVRGVTTDGHILVNDPADFNRANPDVPPPNGHTYTAWPLSELKSNLYEYSK